MNYFGAFGKAAGLSAISLLASFHLAQKYLPNFHSPSPNPNSRHCSQRMPLQSLTQRATSNELQALGITAHNSQLTAHNQFSTFRFQFGVGCRGELKVLCSESCVLRSVFKKEPLRIMRNRKKQQKSDPSQGLMKNVSALGVQIITSQLLIKPMQM